MGTRHVRSRGRRRPDRVAIDGNPQHCQNALFYKVSGAFSRNYRKMRSMGIPAPRVPGIHHRHTPKTIVFHWFYKGSQAITTVSAVGGHGRPGRLAVDGNPPHCRNAVFYKGLGAFSHNYRKMRSMGILLPWTGLRNE